MNCDPLTQQDKMFWILEELDNTKLSSDFESDISNNAFWRSFENSKFYSVYMSSLSVLPPSLAASSENL